MTNNREEQLLRKIERLERKVVNLSEKCNELTYALERERQLTKYYREQRKK